MFFVYFARDAFWGDMFSLLFIALGSHFFFASLSPSVLLFSFFFSVFSRFLLSFCSSFTFLSCCVGFCRLVPFVRHVFCLFFYFYSFVLHIFLLLFIIDFSFPSFYFLIFAFFFYIFSFIFSSSFLSFFFTPSFFRFFSNCSFHHLFTF